MELRSVYGGREHPNMATFRESIEWMIQAALKEKVIVEEENLKDYQKRTKEENVRKFKEKALHGEFVEQTSDIDGEDSWIWLRNGV